MSFAVNLSTLPGLTIASSSRPSRVSPHSCTAFRAARSLCLFIFSSTSESVSVVSSCFLYFHVYSKFCRTKLGFLALCLPFSTPGRLLPFRVFSIPFPKLSKFVDFSSFFGLIKNRWKTSKTSIDPSQKKLFLFCPKFGPSKKGEAANLEKKFWPRAEKGHFRGQKWSGPIGAKNPKWSDRAILAIT